MNIQCSYETLSIVMTILEYNAQLSRRVWFQLSRGKLTRLYCVKIILQERVHGQQRRKQSNSGRESGPRPRSPLHAEWWRGRQHDPGYLRKLAR
ncbi:protein of unknown function [Serratia sp. Tan611]|nr:protein of unknown function [Serratia sp. Tan611]